MKSGEEFLQQLDLLWRDAQGRLEDEKINLIEEARSRLLAKNAEIERLRSTPTAAEVGSACLFYRHDFGLLSGKEQVQIARQALEWLHAWDKARGGQGIDVLGAARAVLRGEGEDV